MASDQGRLPMVVDLTIDSDLDDDEQPAASHSKVTEAARLPLPPASRLPLPPTSRLSLPPASRPSGASTAATQPSTPPVPSLGSSSKTVPTQFIGAQAADAHTSHEATTSKSSSTLSTVTSLTDMWGNASGSKSHVSMPSDTPSSTNTSKQVDRNAKRRKLSTPGGREVAQNHTQRHPSMPVNGKQPSKHRETNSAQVQNVAGTDQRISLGTKLNIMNKMPSVHYMNSALKPSGSSIPFLDEVISQAPRPLLIGRLPQDNASTGLPSPRLTTPESGSVIMIDSDPDEDEKTEVKPIPPLATTKTAEASITRHQSQDDVQGHLSATEGIERATIERAKQSSRSFVFPETTSAVDDDKHNDRNRAYSESFPVTQPTPRTMQQSLASSHISTSTMPPAAKTKPPTKTTPAQFSKEEDHLLIFLKEVKKLKWADITTEFAKDIKGRNYAALQTHYSSSVNKRDRTQDPAMLNLPSRFASESTIDWSTVHMNTAGPRTRTEAAGLSFGAASQQHKHQIGKPRVIQHVRDYEDSSETDTAPQRQRSRRVAPINYTWPRQRTRFIEDDLEENVDGTDYLFGLNSNLNTPTRSDSPMSGTLAMSDLHSAISVNPIGVDFDAEDASLGLATQRGLRAVQKENLPYVSVSQRSAMWDTHKEWSWDQHISRDWQGAVMHVDFSPPELHTVLDFIAAASKPTRQSRHSTYRRQLRAALKGYTDPKLLQLAHGLSQYLRYRDKESILSFLQDAVLGNVSDVPRIQRFVAAKLPATLGSVQKTSIPSTIRRRELGLQARRGCRSASTPLTYPTRNQMIDTLGPRYKWTGASSDIHTVAWSPDGQCFAAGAVDVADQDSMQYNRPNNLLYGNTISGAIHELGEHHIDRPKTEAGANSTHAMYVSQDPKLYTTVSSVAFSPSGKLMYSAGYDHDVCVWDVTMGTSQPQLARQLQHKAPVDILAVNRRFDGLIATASKRTTDKSIKLLSFNEDTINNEDWTYDKWDYASAKAVDRPDLKMTPNALQFDPIDGRLLLAGFGANMRGDSGLDTTGDVCLWDVNTQIPLQVHGSSKNVFDITFNPNPRVQSLFAVGCVAGGNVNRGTRSVVRFYTTKGIKYTCPIELECKAYDMNDVVWCPYDENLVAAGCTDGRVYLWDLRRPGISLCRLSHGASLMPLQEGIPHEKTDTGVRFLSWGQDTTRLYSGSSDGVVRVWDVTRSQEDVYIKDLITANSGIMSGAFSPDYSRLVLGEVNGSVNVLEVGQDDIAIKDADTLQYYPYYSRDEEEDATNGMLDDALPAVPSNTAAAEARHWLQTGQLQLASMGGLPKRQVIQGLHYEGPFDRSEDAYTQFLREQAFSFQKSMATTKGPQCDLPVCADNMNTTTFEEVGDSGRSADRIPDELRRQWLDESARNMPGRTKCRCCGRPALPSASDDGAIMCERCLFTCFRCGGSNRITGVTTTFDCSNCGGGWEVGALGYECDREPEVAVAPLKVPALRKFGRESYLERLEDVDTTFGDEMNALTDYYFGLAIDRPESPPL